MLSVLRIINAVVLSRGAQNDQTIAQARQFIHEFRPCIVAIFKRNAKIGAVSADNEAVLEELVDNFTALISAVGFLEVRSAR